MGSRGSSGNHFGARSFGRDPMFSRFQAFATQQDAIRYHLANNFDWDKWNALLSDEQHGIVSYTSYWYSRINTALREGQTPAGNIQQMIDGATSGLNKWAAAGDVITYRGANLHWTANLLGGTEADLSNPAFLRSRIGRTVVDKGFMSSGTHQNSAWSSDVNYKIYVNKGVSGMYVDAISANSGEYEFLFNRDTRFKVHGIKTNASGRITELVLEAVPTKKKR